MKTIFPQTVFSFLACEKVIECRERHFCRRMATDKEFRWYGPTFRLSHQQKNCLLCLYTSIDLLRNCNVHLNQMNVYNTLISILAIDRAH